MALAAVAFDLDYTLAVPERDRQTLLDEASATVGAPSFSRTEYLAAHRRNLASETRAPIFADLLDSRNADASPADLAGAYRRSIERALVPVVGAEALVRDLRERYRVGLLTDGPVVAQRSKLAVLGWEDLFDTVVITGSLPAGKPDERAFRALLDGLGTESASTVYVGDSAEIDVKGAKRAGLFAVHILGPEQTPAPGADAAIERERLEDLPAVLDDLP